MTMRWPSFFATLECKLIDRHLPSEARSAAGAVLVHRGLVQPARRHSALGYRSPANFDRSFPDEMHTFRPRVEHDLPTVGVCVACATPPVDKSAAQHLGSPRGRKRQPVRGNGSSPMSANRSVFSSEKRCASRNAGFRGISALPPDGARGRAPAPPRHRRRTATPPAAAGAGGLRGARAPLHAAPSRRNRYSSSADSCSARPAPRYGDRGRAQVTHRRNEEQRTKC